MSVDFACLRSPLVWSTCISTSTVASPTLHQCHRAWVSSSRLYLCVIVVVQLDTLQLQSCASQLSGHVFLGCRGWRDVAFNIAHKVILVPPLLFQGLRVAHFSAILSLHCKHAEGVCFSLFVGLFVSARLHPDCALALRDRVLLVLAGVPVSVEDGLLVLRGRSRLPSTTARGQPSCALTRLLARDFGLVRIALRTQGVPWRLGFDLASLML